MSKQGRLNLEGFMRKLNFLNDEFTTNVNIGIIDFILCNLFLLPISLNIGLRVSDIQHIPI